MKKITLLEDSGPYDEDNRGVGCLHCCQEEFTSKIGVKSFKLYIYTSCQKIHFSISMTGFQYLHDLRQSYYEEWCHISMISMIVCAIIL